MQRRSRPGAHFTAVRTVPPRPCSHTPRARCGRDRRAVLAEPLQPRQRLSVPTLLDAVASILTASAQALHPDGIVVITARPWRRDGELIDFPGRIQSLAEHAGLACYERHVALLAAIRDDQFVPRTSFFQLHWVRKARARGLPHLVIAHEDVLVFRRP